MMTKDGTVVVLMNGAHIIHVKDAHITDIWAMKKQYQFNSLKLIINMKKVYIEAALLPITIGLISYGVHTTEAIYCLMGGICTGAYVLIQNNK